MANSLGRDDQVALEATGNALAIARALEPHVARVVAATRTELRAITEAKVKTDRRDARTLARLLAAVVAVDGDADRQVAGAGAHGAVLADLDHQAVEVGDRIDGVQRPRPPRGDVLEDGVGG